MASSRPVFILDEEVEVTAPVHIRVPKSTAATGRGTVKQEFVTKTAFVTFRLPSEDELDAVIDEVRRANDETSKAIAEAQKRLEAAADDDARADIDEEMVRLRKALRLGQVEQLKAFVTGLPEGSGIAEKDGSPAVFSPELIDRLCAFRHVRAALWEAFLLVVNGDGKKGN